MQRSLAATFLLGACFAWAGPSSPGQPADGAADQPIQFAGRDWKAKVARSRGPGPNRWSDAPACVHVDEAGMHLAIAPAGDSWDCSEVSIPPALGHGEYRWVIAGDLASLSPRSVLGLFLYEDDSHEVDFELSRWGKADAPNAQFVVQPTSKDSIHRFDTGKADRVTVGMDWSPSSVRFRCWTGEDLAGAPVEDWTYAGPKVPAPGKERVIMNFWLKDGKASPEMKREEVVIRSFTFRPPAGR